MGVVVHCSGGGKAGQGKMEAAWLDQLPRAPRPSFHTDPVQCCHCSTALLEGLFGRGMSERWLLETTFWRLHSWISQVIQVQWVHSGVKYSREQTEPSSTVFHSWEHFSRKVLPTPSNNVYLTWNKQHVHWCMVESLTGTLLTFVGGVGASDDLRFSSFSSIFQRDLHLIWKVGMLRAQWVFQQLKKNLNLHSFHSSAL